MNKSTYIYLLMKETPFLEAFMQEGIINLSALAKKIVPMMQKKDIEATESAVLMALRRFNTPFTHKQKGQVVYMSQLGEISVHPNLMFFRFHKGNMIHRVKKRLLNESENEHFYHLLFESHFSATVVLRMDDVPQKEKLLSDIPVMEKKANLSALTIEFSNEEIRAPGLYYTLFKQLAWHNINVYEVISSGREITMLVDSEKVKEVMEMVHTPKIELF